MADTRFDLWLGGQHWALRFGVWCLRVALVLTVIYFINRAVS